MDQSNISKEDTKNLMFLQRNKISLWLQERTESKYKRKVREMKRVLFIERKERSTISAMTTCTVGLFLLASQEDTIVVNSTSTFLQYECLFINLLTILYLHYHYKNVCLSICLSISLEVIRIKTTVRSSVDKPQNTYMVVPLYLI